MKKFIKNVFYFIEINAILAICHFLALLGVAFNDAGDQYSNVFEALHIILFGTAPLIAGTIILINKFKKKEDFAKYTVSILQILLILAWAMYYIVNYVPDSAINKYMQAIENKQIVKTQIQKNEEALEELESGYKTFDSVERAGQKLSLYLSENNKKVIIELKSGDSVNYCMVDTIVNYDLAKQKISKYNSEYNVQFDGQNQLSIVLDSVQYGVYKEMMLDGWNAPMKYMVSIYIGTEAYNPINLYKEMIFDSIAMGENIYFINDSEF